MKLNFLGLDITQKPVLPFGVKFDSFRFWDNGCRWQVMNPALGSFVPTNAKEWIETLIESGIKDCIFELGSTPTWASSQPNNSGCDDAIYGLGSCSPPCDLKPDGTGANLFWREWCKNIGQFFSQYPKLQVSAWCPWNEFTRQADWNGNKSWLGTNEQMVRLAQDARAILLGRGHIHATGEEPEQALKTVGLTGPAYTVNTNQSFMLCPSSGPEQLEHLLSYLQTEGAPEAAEILAVHLYNLTGQDAADNCIHMKEAVAPYMSGKPIWMTEGSCGTRTPTQPMDEFVTSFYSLLEPIVDRVYWYAYEGDAAALWDGKKLTEAGQAYMGLAQKGL